MKQRFILFRRAGVFYSEDTATRKQTSLRTKDQAEAITLLNTKNAAIYWPDHMISFQRCKTKVPVVITFGAEAAAVLQTLPKFGRLFPWLSQLHEKHRAKHFIKRLATLSIGGVSLHSYRYAWAERAKVAGMNGKIERIVSGGQSGLNPVGQNAG